MLYYKKVIQCGAMLTINIRIFQIIGKVTRDKSNYENIKTRVNAVNEVNQAIICFATIHTL